jgi:hypothetical protein
VSDPYCLAVTDVVGDLGTSPPATTAAPRVDAPIPDTPAGTGSPDPQQQSRLRAACAAAAAPVLIAFGWLLMEGTWSPLRRRIFDNFFDAQARAFMDGHWDVPRSVVAFEGFEVGGKTYMYFGPWPALLRMPLLAVTDRFDGRLTSASMALAMAVLAVAAYRLNLAVREIVRGGVGVTRGEIVATAGLAVVVLAGPPLWLASAAVVYHEAILWGLALTLATLDAAARWMLRPTPGRLVLIGVLGVLAVSSRQTLGLGLVAGLGAVAVVAWTARLRRRAQRSVDPLPGVRPGGLLLVCGVLVIVAALPNLARFGDPLGPPIDRQIASSTFDDRKAFLEANGDNWFGPQFVPTTLLQYSRPDAFDLRGSFPWLDFPAAGPTVVGDVTFDDLEWSSSVPVTMPVLVVLAIPGAAWLVGTARRRNGPGVGLLLLWVGTGVGAAGAIAIGYIAHRYLADFMPLVLLPALVGFHVLLRAAPTARRGRRGAAAVALVLLLAVGVWVNAALAVENQRERGKFVTEQARAQLFRWRADLPGGGAPVVTVDSGSERLPDASDGTLAVVGDCLGFYVRVGETWWGVDRGPGTGVYDIAVDLDALRVLDTGERAPLLTLGRGAGASVVALTRLTGGEVRVDTFTPGTGGWAKGTPAPLDGRVTVRLSADPRVDDNRISVGSTVLHRSPTRDPAAEPTVGALANGAAAPGVAERYPGETELMPYDPSLCQDATGAG